MKKLSEVCKIVGVTRRTLQEYKKLGLLEPTCTSEKGYWYYDDLSIWKLLVIQVFREVGYERKTIKSILESPTLDMLNEFDLLIENLEEKRSRLEGMINTIKFMKITARLPESVIRAMSNVDVARIYKDKSFASYFEDSITNLVEYTESDNTEAELYMPFIYSIYGIGLLVGNPEDSKQVQDVVEQSYMYMLEMAKEDEEETDEYVTESEVLDAFLEVMQEIVNSPVILKQLEDNCGEEAVAYIIRSVQVFCERKKRDL